MYRHAVLAAIMSGFPVPSAPPRDACFPTLRSPMTACSPADRSDAFRARLASLRVGFGGRYVPAIPDSLAALPSRRLSITYCDVAFRLVGISLGFGGSHMTPSRPCCCLPLVRHWCAPTALIRYCVASTRMATVPAVTSPGSQAVKILHVRHWDGQWQAGFRPGKLSPRLRRALTPLCLRTRELPA